MTRRATLSYVIEYAAAMGAVLAIQSMPLRIALRAGEAIGHFAWLLSRKRRRRAVENLMHSFPDMPRRTAEKTTHDVFVHFGRAMAETAVAHRFMRPSNYRRHVVIRNEESFKRLVAEGRGAIIVTAHLGAWELFGMVLSHLGAPPHIVYRKMKNPFIDRFLRKRRARFGQTMVERRGALRPLLRILRQRGYTAFLVDQHVRRNPLWVPFFGRLASTTPGPAMLALTTGAPIICGCGVRLPGTYRFEMTFAEPIRPVSTGDRRADVQRITEKISHTLEEFVRKTPEQWLWMHRRWHNPPPEVAAKGE